MKMDDIQKNLLLQIADLHGIPEGAYNIRSNSHSIGRASTANIEITPKEDRDGIDIKIKPGTKNESVHIPVIMNQSGLKELVYNDFYIGAGADVNAKEKDDEEDICVTPLHEASGSGYANIVIALINAGADVNPQGNDGWTPLHSASLYGHTDVVIALINASADVNAKTNDGRTPLDIALGKNRTEVAKVLRGAGAVS